MSRWFPTLARSFEVLFLLAFSLTTPALGQELTGSLEGRAIDPDGRPVAGANVTVSGPRLLGQRTVSTLQDGYFKVPLLPVGEVDVVLQHPDFQPVRISGVKIALGQTVSLGRVGVSTTPVRMEVVEVRGRSLLDEGSTEIGGNLTQEDLEYLPTQRDYREVLAYLPHVDGTPLPPAVALPGGGINIAGSSGTENAYVVDGTNVTDGFFGDTGIQLPPDFIREIELKTGGYQAEYGRSSGGIVNVLTKSGTDTFESQVFGFFTNNDFASDRARSFLDLEQQKFSRYDVGVGLGGPMVPQKLNYYLAYNPSVATEDLVLPGGTAHQDKMVTHRFAAKLNWKAGADTDVTVSGFGDPTSWDRVGISHVAPIPTASLANPDPLLGTWDTGGFALVLSAQHRLGDRVFLQADLSRVESSKQAVPATARGAEEARFNDWATGEVEGGYGYTFDHRSLRYAGGLKGTVYLGSQELKAGLEYEDNLLDDEWYFKTSSGEPGILTTFNNGVTFAETLMDIDQEMRHRIPSAFLQDSWRATDRLRLYAGLRWDGLYIVNPDGVTAGRILDQYQPRTGITYTLGSDQSHRLFGSFGRFYEQMPTVSSFVLGKYRFDNRVFSCDPRTCDPDTLAFIPQGPDGTARVGDDIRGPHYDEFIAGYDYQPGNRWTFGVRGIYRDLREAIDNAPPFNWVNPGRGVASHLPRPKREYTALELTVSRQRDTRWHWSASYVLSKLYGNYGGPGTGVFYPHWSTNFNAALSYVNGEGLLENDRTHVLKTYGSYSFDMGLTVGGFFTWQSGTPINEGGIVPPNASVFLTPRGSYGRTPAIWDLNLRLSYDVTGLRGLGRVQPRLLLDVFHLFGEEEVTGVNMLRYVEVDPETLEGLTENENFGRPQAWQPPMTVRLGIETRF